MKKYGGEGEEWKEGRIDWWSNKTRLNSRETRTEEKKKARERLVMHVFSVTGRFIDFDLRSQ